MASEERMLRVGKQAIQNLSLKIGAVHVEFNSETGMLIYNRKVNELVMNGVTIVGAKPVTPVPVVSEVVPVVSEVVSEPEPHKTKGK